MGATEEITHRMIHQKRETNLMNIQPTEYQPITLNNPKRWHELSIKTNEGDATKTIKILSAPHLTEVMSHGLFGGDIIEPNNSNGYEVAIKQEESLGSSLVAYPSEPRCRGP